MRPTLNKVNESNRNIITFATTGIFIDSESVAESSWLDISRSEMFCFYSDTFDVYLKFPFAQVTETTHKLPLVLEVIFFLGIGYVDDHGLFFVFLFH